MTDKKTIVTISDHPMASSGVGIQTRYIIEHLIKTGKYKVISIAAALKHNDYRPQKVKEWGDDCVIIPCNGYGDANLLRSIMMRDNPSALWIMTDPRFYGWLFHMEHEVRQKMPILYNTIWDNYPAPQYNKSYYNSVDFLGCINKVVYDCANELGAGDKAEYIPHGVPEDQFKILHDKTSEKLKLQYLGEEYKDSFVLFYNSRNAMRKRTGNVVMAFKEFRDNLPEEVQKKVVLLMHTPPKDPEGQDLHKILNDFNLHDVLKFSDKKVSPEIMCELYNMSDATVSMSSEEGFGLCILESLMCGTPVVCTRTGGMKDQAIQPETGREWGFCVEPQARSLIGSQVTPYIWSDHFDPSVAASKMRELYDDWKSDSTGYKNRWAGEEARADMLNRFNLKDILNKWEQKFDEVISVHESRERTVETVTI